MAIGETTQNQGTLRKAIWAHIQEKFPGEVDYRDFLLVINNQVKIGKLVNENGHFRVYNSVYEDLLKSGANEPSQAAAVLGSQSTAISKKD